MPSKSSSVIAEKADIESQKRRTHDTVGVFITITIALFLSSFVLLSVDRFIDNNDTAYYAVPIVVGLFCILVSFYQINSSALSSGLIFGSLSLILESMYRNWYRITEDHRLIIIGSTLALTCGIAYSKLP